MVPLVPLTRMVLPIRMDLKIPTVPPIPMGPPILMAPLTRTAPPTRMDRTTVGVERMLREYPLSDLFVAIAQIYPVE